MKVSDIMKNKKIINIIFTVCEIIIVALIMFSGLIFVKNKINTGENKTNNVANQPTTENKTSVSVAEKYKIEVNVAKNAVIVYQYSDNNNEKKALKVFPCSIGKNVKKGKYKLSKSYTWIKNDSQWHKYNTKYDEGAWIQSVGYSDKYSNTLIKKSYNTVGNKLKSGKNIVLYGADAAWINNNCENITELTIKKGNKTKSLPLRLNKKITLNKHCGWDPTDIDKNNPYQKKSNGTIAVGLKTVTVEKGSKINYFNNILVLDEDGTDITASGKFKKISSDKLKTTKVKFTYTLKSGKTISDILNFKVVDTTKPKVTCLKTQFTYQVKSKDQKDMNTEANITAIVNMVKAQVSCNEDDVIIRVKTVEPMELKEGYIPVSIEAQDKSGNVGSCQVTCKITVKA